jgi:hypothetical protein
VNEKKEKTTDSSASVHSAVLRGLPRASRKKKEKKKNRHGPWWWVCGRQREREKRKTEKSKSTVPMGL